MLVLSMLVYPVMMCLLNKPAVVAKSTETQNHILHKDSRDFSNHLYF